MKNSDATKNNFEKKSERLDIRVSHEKKQAFTKACENQGDTPSNAVRRFITAYTRRATHDDFGAIIRTIPWRRTAAALVTIIALGYGGLSFRQYISQAKTTRLTTEVFNIYDENKNGLIELGEIAPNDFHLHRVLNIDGKDGISRDEFYSKATMIWRFVDPDSFRVIENKTGRLRQKVVTRSIVAVTHNGNTRILLNDPDQKKYIMVDGVPVELKDYDTILNNIGSLGLDYGELRQSGTLPDFSAEHLRKYNMKMVKFDLRNPDKLELTVYEQTINGLHGSSISSFQRSVTWVEGRKTPEHVAGMGRDKAVLTKEAQAN